MAAANMVGTMLGRLIQASSFARQCLDAIWAWQRQTYMDGFLPQQVDPSYGCGP